MNRDKTPLLSAVAILGAISGAACATQEIATPQPQTPWAAPSSPLLANARASAISPAPPSNDVGTGKTQAASEPMVSPLEPESRVHVRIDRMARVLANPARDAVVLGVISSGSRVEVIERRSAESCASDWIHIAPRGWVCTATSPAGSALTTSTPRLQGPGTAGRVRADRLVFADRAAVIANDGEVASGRPVRMAGTVLIDDKIYWNTRAGELVAARDVARSRGSSFEGVFLSETTELRLPIAFAHRARARGANIPVHSSPSGRRVDWLASRSAVNIEATSVNGTWLQIGEGRWIAAMDARVAEAATPPQTVGADETWLDFDRDTQIAVLYRGATPIYATLSSSGKYGHRTPVGVYRVEKKIARTTMSSRPDADEPYEVKNVPWTLFFHGGYAVHGAYWHNKFGTPVSHGCLNLALTDAKLVYDLLGPQVPAGWSVATATDATPGSVVRVKSRKTPQPVLRGSAVAFAAKQEQSARDDMVAAR